MANSKLARLLGALKTGTEANRVTWEDLPDEEMFRARVFGGLVRVGQTDTPGARGYKLWLIGAGGLIAGEFEVMAGEPEYELIRDVYNAARLAARGGDELIDNIIFHLAG